MRIAAIVVLTCGCACACAQPAGIQGTVLDSTTRQPLAGAHITLYGIRSDATGVDNIYGAISKADGQYSVANMQPGVYTLTVQHNAFMQVPAKGVEAAANFSITLKAGEIVTNQAIEMAPRVAITGRVTDEYGDPLRGLQIQAVPPSGISVNPMSRGMYGNTDERGQFRITGPPGKYRVKAIGGRPPQSYGVAEVRADGSQAAVYANTWYPGSDSEERAVLVDVIAGHEATGIEIRMVRLRSLSVAGIVSGLPDRNSRPQVFLFPAGNVEMTQQFQGMRSTQAGVEGKFSFAAIPPGAYRLWALMYGGAGGAAMRSAAVDVTVSNADVDGVSIGLAKGEEMSGAIEFQGGAKPREKLAITLEPLSQIEKSYFGTVVASEVDKDGAFRIDSVLPARLRVKIDGLPENGYVKAVKLDSAESEDGVVDLTRGVRGSKLRVTVGLDGGQVEGTIVGEDGKPLKLPITLVALMQNADDIAWDSVKKVLAGQSFSFKGLKPGKYRLLALDAMAQSSIEDAKALFPKGTEITVREGARITREIRLTGKEKANANQ